MGWRGEDGGVSGEVSSSSDYTKQFSLLSGLTEEAEAGQGDLTPVRP